MHDQRNEWTATFHVGLVYDLLSQAQIDSDWLTMKFVLVFVFFITCMVSYSEYQHKFGMKYFSAFIRQHKENIIRLPVLSESHSKSSYFLMVSYCVKKALRIHISPKLFNRFNAQKPFSKTLQVLMRNCVFCCVEINWNKDMNSRR
jgi:hypothetical protein